MKRTFGQRGRPGSGPSPCATSAEIATTIRAATQPTTAEGQGEPSSTRGSVTGLFTGDTVVSRGPSSRRA